MNIDRTRLNGFVIDHVTDASGATPPCSTRAAGRSCAKAAATFLGETPAKWNHPTS